MIVSFVYQEILLIEPHREEIQVRKIRVHAHSYRSRQTHWTSVNALSAAGPFAANFLQPNMAQSFILPSPISNPCSTLARQMSKYFSLASRPSKMCKLRKLPASPISNARSSSYKQNHISELEARLAELERIRRRRKPSTGGQLPEPPISS